MTEQICRHCGCTEEWACQGGCHWILEDVCSQCVTLPDLLTYLRRYAELIFVIAEFPQGAAHRTLSQLPDHFRSEYEAAIIQNFMMTSEVPARAMSFDELAEVPRKMLERITG